MEHIEGEPWEAEKGRLTLEFQVPVLGKGLQTVFFWYDVQTRMFHLDPPTNERGVPVLHGGNNLEMIAVFLQAAAMTRRTPLRVV